MATKIAETEWLRTMVGPEVAENLSTGGATRVAMGETAAQVRGARVGDVLTLRTSRFARRDALVVAIVADWVVDSGDLLMSAGVALNKFGIARISSVAIVGMESPTRVLRGLGRVGIVPGTTWRLRTSWDPPNPDGTLGSATVKKLFGEVPYKPTGGPGIVIDPAWATANISWQRRYLDVRLRNNCHKVVATALQSALTAIADAGLASVIDAANTNRIGGCFTGRFNRIGRSYPSPSRHSLGIAVDINPTANPVGGEPVIDCRVVRIMREHGFAWGGNFWPSDGMHFEWVGEPRHELGFPSGRCRNRAPSPSTTLPGFSGTTVTPTTTSSTVVENTTTTIPEVTSTSVVPSTAPSTSVASGT